MLNTFILVGLLAGMISLGVYLVRKQRQQPGLYRLPDPMRTEVRHPATRR